MREFLGTGKHAEREERKAMHLASSSGGLAVYALRLLCVWCCNCVDSQQALRPTRQRLGTALARVAHDSPRLGVLLHYTVVDG